VSPVPVDGVVRPFPVVRGRNLLGEPVELPAGLDGSPRVVVVAFRQPQQRQVDSWVPWLEEQAGVVPGLRFYEVPSISGRWSPTRRFIDGGMATSIRDPVVLARTITFYGDLTRLTVPLGIDRTDDIWVFALDDAGNVVWSGTGGFDAVAAESLGTSLRALADAGAADTAVAAAEVDGPRVERFEFAWNPRYRAILAVMGVRPSHAHVTVTGDRLVVRFGPWVLDTPLANVTGTQLTGGYHWYKAIGARLSLADHGVTFGTDTARGVCICFAEPVTALDPAGLVHHPGATLTVDDPDRLAAVIRARLAG
jgi:hypothetical protein